MKKLMIGAMVALMGVAANASAVNWEVDMESSTYKQMTYYAVVGDYSSTLMTALSTEGYDSFISELGTIGTANYKTGKLNNVGYVEGSFYPVNADNMSIFVLSGTEGGNDFWYTADTDVSYAFYDPPKSAEETAQFYRTDGIFSKSTVAAVPEPTSGLLLLLGVAGLALKRRRA